MTESVVTTIGAVRTTEGRGEGIIVERKIGIGEYRGAFVPYITDVVLSNAVDDKNVTDLYRKVKSRN